jgi:SAM-dependent methyltransferase
MAAAVTSSPDSGSSFRVGYGSAAPASRAVPRAEPLHAQVAMSDASLVGLLRCPRCPDSSLKEEGDAWVCATCATRFPLLDGMPWLFAEPQATLGEWRDRLHRLILELQNDAAQVRAELGRENLRSLTRSRLKLLSGAYDDHARRLQAVLAPLDLGGKQARLTTHMGLRTRLPASQDLTSYYVNLHRDWVWGREENEASFRLLEELRATHEPGRTLVLGTGASRLAYDFHTRSAPALTVGVDINPLLLLAARRIVNGSTVSLYEFPLAPRRLDDHAILRQLTAEKPVGERFHLVLADALRAPFAAESFDTVITPWFVDIVAADLAELAPRINRLLRPGGRWLNFGSLSFGHREAALCYTREETLEILKEQGFDCVAEREVELPYMRSPASRHARLETVVAFAAAKRTAVAQPSEHQSLPEWLIDEDQPVPLLPPFEMTAVATRIYAFVMSLIDGRRSARDIAQVLVAQKLMNADEAGPAVRAFLTRMHEDARASMRR